MSFRDTDTASASQFSSAVSLAGSFARYAFYFFGAIVMAIIALFAIWMWSNRVVTVSEKPAFRIADGSVARLPVSMDVVVGGFGRIEVMQYGTLQNRSTDLTVVMAFPPKDAPNSVVLRGDLRETHLLRNARSIRQSTNYDLETRYGPVHAVDMRIEADGRWKQCLSFSTRFNTNAVSLMGWVCDATGTKPGADALACALDKLVIERPLASKEADAYMRERMARPANCSASNVSQTIDVRSRSVSPPSRWSQPSSRTRLY
ncbi:hypothetical protein RPMA_17175 [Tardiphaga alba]|uniref:Transmembrane protein n=1 Tax=Tardiphaga alba TaxID=340268 RepID=A0ABX8A9G2_9BRAD|nr:hypothetical protein [Tardiphaga alba]QUS40373.1 hypothetical protein RPMA_17175 [Tardiphaga alba]